MAQVTDLDSSPTSSLAESLGEQLPGRTVPAAPEAPVRPGPFRLLTSPLGSSTPVLGVVRILGSPTTLFVASTSRGTRRHITMPVRPTAPPGWSERLGEIDVWCPAMPFGQLLSHATPSPQTTARCLADGAAASDRRESRSTAATAEGRCASTRASSVTDQDLAFVSGSPGLSAAAGDGAAAAGSPLVRGTTEGDAGAVAAAGAATRDELMPSGQPVSAEDIRSPASSSSSSRLPLPWTSTVVKCSPQLPGQQQRQGAAAEGTVDASGSGCAICIEDFVDSSIVRALPCGHVFHRLCLDSWFERSSVCPLCLHDYQQAWRRSDGSTSDNFCPPPTSLVLLSFRPLAPRGGATSAAAAGGTGRGASRGVLFTSQSSRTSIAAGPRNSIPSATRSSSSGTSYPTIISPPPVTYYRRTESYQNSRGHYRASRNTSRITGNLSAYPTPTRQRLGSQSPGSSLLTTTAPLSVINTATQRSPFRQAGATTSPVADAAGAASARIGAAGDIVGGAPATAEGAAVPPAVAAAPGALRSAIAGARAIAGMHDACAAAGTGATPVGASVPGTGATPTVRASEATTAASAARAGAGAATTQTSTLPSTPSTPPTLGVTTVGRTGGQSRVPRGATPAGSESAASAAAAAATAAATSDIMLRGSAAQVQNALPG